MGGLRRVFDGVPGSGSCTLWSDREPERGNEETIELGPEPFGPGPPRYATASVAFRQLSMRGIVTSNT